MWKVSRKPMLDNEFTNFVTLNLDRIHTWTCHSCNMTSFGRGKLFEHIADLHWDKDKVDFRHKKGSGINFVSFTLTLHMKQRV